MNRKKIMIATIILVVLCVAISLVLYYKYKKGQENREQQRYNEIRKNVKTAVELNIGAMYPNCEISDGFKDLSGTHYNSSFLINNGYIKKEKLLDIDNKSYCDVYVDIRTEYKDKLDHQKDCKIYYKIYLKCNNLEDKGYINWGVNMKKKIII